MYEDEVNQTPEMGESLATNEDETKTSVEEEAEAASDTEKVPESMDTSEDDGKSQKDSSAVADSDAKKEKEKKWYKNKSFIIPTVIAVIFAFLWLGSSTGLREELNNTKKELNNTKEELSNTGEELDNTKRKLSALQTEYDEYKEKTDPFKEELSALQTEYDEYKEKMEPFEEFSLDDIKQAKKAREEEEKEKQKELEEENKKGYNTGITYDQLARTPDKYLGKKVKFSGKVVQVIEGDDEIQIRLAVNDDYDTIVFASYDPSIVESRILEDDRITIYGLSIGTISYQSTMGGQITIPGVSIDKIDQ